MPDTPSYLEVLLAPVDNQRLANQGIAFTISQSEDVVRHPFVQRIVNAYDQRGTP